MPVSNKSIYSLSRLEKIMRKMFGSYKHYFKDIEFPEFKDYRSYFRGKRETKTFSLNDGVQFLSVYLSSKGIKENKDRDRAILLILKNSSLSKPQKHFPVISKIQKKVQLQNENFKKRDLDGLLGKTVSRPKDYNNKKWGNYSIRTVNKK